jgi:hypothetical protein
MVQVRNLEIQKDEGCIKRRCLLSRKEEKGTYMLQKCTKVTLLKRSSGTEISLRE